mmetsp:Transcript_11511/g.35152  ORF Transcript_11511/g.35152 Transcript_11511/m.35152 type:complete len:539 (+) Transcript_11511:57-1673(+)
MFGFVASFHGGLGGKLGNSCTHSKRVPVRACVSPRYDDVVSDLRREMEPLPAKEALEKIRELDKEYARSQKVHNGVLETVDVLFGAAAIEEASRVLLETAERVPNLYSYNALLRIYARNGDFDRVVKLKEDVEAAGLKLDVVAFSIVMHAYGKAGRGQEAERLMGEMIQQGIKPNAVTFNTLLRCLIQVENFTRFWYWRSEMQVMKVSDSDVTRSILIEAYLRSHNLEGAEGMLKKMIQKRQMVKAEMLVRVMDEYASIGDVAGVERCRQLFDEAGVDMGDYAFNVMLKAFWEIRDAEGMMRTSQMMRVLRVKPTAVTFTTLMKACASRGDVRRVRKCFGQMFRAGIKPDVVAYNTLLHALRISRDLRGAERAYKQMLSDNVEPDVVTFNTMMKLYSDRNMIAEVKALYGQLEDLGLDPTEFTYNTLIDAYGSGGDVDGAEKVLSRMVSEGKKPSVITLTSLVHAHARNGDLFMAERIFRTIFEQHDIRPNEVTYACLIHAFERAGRATEARALRDEANRLGFVIKKAGKRRDETKRG